jgi:hypothetical protein
LSATFHCFSCQSCGYVVRLRSQECAERWLVKRHPSTARLNAPAAFPESWEAPSTGQVETVVCCLRVFHLNQRITHDRPRRAHDLHSLQDSVRRAKTPIKTNLRVAKNLYTADKLFKFYRHSLCGTGRRRGPAIPGDPSGGRDSRARSRRAVRRAIRRNSRVAKFLRGLLRDGYDSKDPRVIRALERRGVRPTRGDF